MPGAFGRVLHYRIWMVAIALTLRLAVVAFLYPERLNPDRDHWRFAGETGRIARSVVQGKGFSNPLHADTGPTAWMTPLYPLLLALVFKIFGIYTTASAIVMLSLDSLFSALTCIPIFGIANARFGERVARWVGWTWAFFPYAIYFSADFIWATTLTTLMLALIFWAALHVEDWPTVIAWTSFGLLCGLSALIDPVVLSVAIPLVLWMAFRLSQWNSQWIMRPLMFAVAFSIVIAPWFVRNYRVFHTFIPFRDNIGLEFYVGNNGETWHFAPGGFHPSDTPREWEEFQQLGELHYMQHKQQLALEFISGHPAFFAKLSLRRALYMWTSFWSLSRRYLNAEPTDPFNIVLCTGLTILALTGLWKASRFDYALMMPFAIALFCFPLVYYVTHPEDYYRRPIDPIFIVLAVYAVVEWTTRKKLADSRALYPIEQELKETVPV